MAARTLPVSAALVLWVVLGLAAAIYGNWIGLGGRGFAIALGVLLVLLAGEILFAAGDLAQRVAARLNREAALLLALAPLALYLVYALGTFTLTPWRAALAAVYTLGPPLLLWSARGEKPGRLQDYGAVLLLWLPVEFRWLLALWPDTDRLGYVLTTLLAVNVGVIAFLLVRQLDGAGYSIAWGRRWGWIVGGHFLAFAVVAILLGQAIGFIAFEPQWDRLKTLPFTMLGILLFTAWPEEFLFRGLVQNLLGRTLRSPTAGWLAGSVVFGLSHLNNLGFPNWRYALLATIAGLFYGRVWMQTGSLFPAALLHMLVNTAWLLFFRTL